ncbi:hypothetical protein PMAYCL1PPCAC_10778, partial [Pristionchus mayeri]
MLRRSTKKNARIRRFVSMTDKDQVEMVMTLEKEEELHEDRMRVNELQRKLQVAEEQNRHL